MAKELSSACRLYFLSLKRSFHCSLNSFCMLIHQGLNLCCSEKELSWACTWKDRNKKISLHQKSNNNLWVKGSGRRKTIDVILTRCPFLEEYLLPLSTLPPFDQHLILLFLTQYTGMGTWHHASDFLSVVLLPLKGYWNKVHKEPSSLKSGKRLMVSFFSWRGFLWSTCDKAHFSEYAS